MIITEIKNVVVDTINFILPPFGKVLFSLWVAYYITYGHLTDYIHLSVSQILTSLDLDEIKILIDKFYISSILPIILTLTIIGLAYLINRIGSFLSSLIPLSLTSQLRVSHHRNGAYIWQFFSEIESPADLEIKVKDLFETIKLENKSPLLKTLQYRIDRKEREFLYIDFALLITIIAIISYSVTKIYITPSLSSLRFIIFFIAVMFIILLLFARAANSLFEVKQAELWIVEQHLRKKDNFKLGYSIDKEICERVESQKRLFQKWWWIEFRFKTNWFKMFKYYKFRLPFKKYFKLKKANKKVND